jgi:hypothetical protein
MVVRSPWQRVLIAAAPWLVAGCTQAVVLGTECRQDDATCSDAGVVAQLPRGETDPGRAGTSAGTIGREGGGEGGSGSVVPSTLALPVAGGPAVGDGGFETRLDAGTSPSVLADGAVTEVLYPGFQNPSFEIGEGSPGDLAYQPPGSPALGPNTIAPWTACVPGMAALTSSASITNAGDFGPTADAVFAKLPILASTFSGLTQELTVPLKAGRTYGFRVDLRSTAASPSLHLNVYDVAVPCLGNLTSPLAISANVDNAGWRSVCVVFTPHAAVNALMLTAATDEELFSRETLFVDNVRADPSCASQR